MRRGKKTEKVSRKQLADPRLGMSYNARLQQTTVEVRRGVLNIKEHGNGYATLIRVD